MRKKLAVIILSIMVSVTMFPLSVLASNETAQQDKGGVASEQSGAQEEQGSAEVSGSETGGASAEGETSVTERETPVTEGETEQPLLKEPVRGANEWLPEDFTYGNYEKRLYGCDYSRDFVMTGEVVTGFSDSGLEKLKTNKDLVIPREDPDGTPLMGVGDKAFYAQGLKSVTFPSGVRIPYDDTVTHKITKRGNFIIGTAAFSKNELTEVNLPDGVIAVLANAFQYNKIEKVTLPRSIWWVETLAFAGNQISEVNFPLTCDFSLEIHGQAFFDNQIKSIRLPDFTEVLFKYAFGKNPGMEPCPADAPDKEKAFGGLVYMYTDNPDLANKQRIHHLDRPTENQKSWHQKLIINDPGTQDPSSANWGIDDFTYDGTTITGLSDSGKAKRAVNKNLVIPERNAAGETITELASSTEMYGLFATDTEKFDSVALPDGLKKVGNKAFFNNGLKEVTFSPNLEEMGVAAFSNNSLKTAILPDTLTKLGAGAFATNPTLEAISLPKGIKEIPAGAFGCSDAKNWMEKLTSINIPDGVTSIGDNAFAGNNFHEITIPESVKSIGRFAFSTKNYLKDPCTLNLNEGLETIGKEAFRNKVISSVNLPSTVKSLPDTVFRKAYSGGTQPVVTKVFVSTKEQYEDSANFPKSDYHKLYLTDSSVWTADDFTYGEWDQDLYPADDVQNIMTEKVWAVTGLTEQGEGKLAVNKDLVIPKEDPDGKAVTGVGTSAFYKKGIKSVTFPEGVKKAYSGNWNTSLTERGNFYIGESAFLGNEISCLELPDGVIYIGGNAFKNNKNLTTVKLPKTIMQLSSGAFASCAIDTLSFHAETDFPLQVDNMAFAKNKIQSVRIPDNTSKLTKWAFLQNTGKEPVTSGTAAEQKGGIVYLYVGSEDKLGSFVDTVNNTKSNVQKIIVGEQPAEDMPWNINDFTYDATGTVITGLTESGQKKTKIKPIVELPDKGPTAANIIAIGDGVGGVGTIGVKDGTGTYVPSGVILPNKLQSIGKFAFSGANIKEIDLPDTLVKIDSAAFQGSKLESVVIPDTVTSIGVGAFSNSSNLKEVKLSGSLKEIPQAAFTMTALENIDIPEGVTTIGRNAFAGAHAKTVSLPSTLKTIGNAAFRNHQFTELEIPAGVETIDQYAFDVHQEGLQPTLAKLTLHEGLKSIGNRAFGKSLIESVEIPSTLETLHKDAFKGNTVGGAGQKALLKTSDKTKVDNPPAGFVAEGSGHTVLYDKLANTGWTEDDFTYDGDTITGFSDSGKEKFKNNKDIVLPDKAPGGADIKKIGNAAFKGDGEEWTKFGVLSPNGIKSVDLPAGLESIEDEAFKYNSISEVNLPSGIKSIKYHAFHGNQITKVILPDSVDTLGEGVFSTNSITELKLPNNPNFKEIPGGAFAMNIRLAHIDIPNTVESIGEMAFSGARLEDLTIPKSVKEIKRKAFHLHHIKDLTIPGNVRTIGESAFEGTFKALTLEKLTIEEGVEDIGKHAFKEGLLKDTDLPSSIKSIGKEAFINNTGNGDDHTVYLHTKNPDHIKFNDTRTPDYEVIYEGQKNKIVSGEGGTYKKGKANPKPLKFKTSDPSKYYKKVTVDGKDLTEGKDYTKTGDESGEISLTPEFLDTLEDGEHTLKVESATGTATAKFNIGKVVYDCIEGDGASWQQGSGNPLEFTFRYGDKPDDNANRTFVKFEKLLLDDEVLDAANYETKSGSLIVNLKPEYLEGLAVGGHKLTAVFSNGKADAHFNVTKAGAAGTTSGAGGAGAAGGTSWFSRYIGPKTGDSNAAAYVLLAIIVCGAMLGALAYRKRKASNK